MLSIIDLLIDTSIARNRLRDYVDREAVSETVNRLSKTAGITRYQAVKLLIAYVHAEPHFLTIGQVGGFVYTSEDSTQTKIMNVIDTFMAFVAMLPMNTLLTSLVGPYALISFAAELLRGNYYSACFSLLMLIPDIGQVMGGMLKIVDRMHNYFMAKEENKRLDKFYKQMKLVKEVAKELAPINTKPFMPYDDVNLDEIVEASIL